MHHGEQKGSVVLFEELGNAADASRAWGYSAAEWRRAQAGEDIQQMTQHEHKIGPDQPVKFMIFKYYFLCIVFREEKKENMADAERRNR